MTLLLNIIVRVVFGQCARLVLTLYNFYDIIIIESKRGGSFMSEEEYLEILHEEVMYYFHISDDNYADVEEW